MYLRIIAAITGEQIVDIADRLCRAEANRVLADWPEGKLIVIHGSKKEGDIYVDRFIATDNERGGSAGGASDDRASDARDGDEVAGDDAV